MVQLEGLLGKPLGPKLKLRLLLEQQVSRKPVTVCKSLRLRQPGLQVYAAATLRKQGRGWHQRVTCIQLVMREQLKSRLSLQQKIPREEESRRTARQVSKEKRPEQRVSRMKRAGRRPGGRADVRSLSVMCDSHKAQVAKCKLMAAPVLQRPENSPVG